jgi:LPXTG-motif cell wall-anchored protein
MAIGVGPRWDQQPSTLEGLLMKRASKRSLTVIAVPTLAILVGMFAWTGTASAHNVSNIDADCTHVTVQFANFPEAGVNVHIAAAIEGHGTLAADALIDDDSTVATVNISSATSLLFGASVHVEVDVTWTFDGAQHEHEEFTVTCGSSTTTIKQATTTTVADGGTTTTTAAGGGSTTTTVTSGGSTSTTVAGSGGGSTTTTVAGSVDDDTDDTVGGDTGDTDVNGTVSGGGALTAGGEVAVLGETAASTSSTLPRTGSTTGPMLAFGALALICGAGAVVGARRHLIDS